MRWVLETLVAARALRGLAGAPLVPTSLAIITEVHPVPIARGAAIGVWTAWTSAAIAVGPPLGGVLVDAVSWRLVFAINVPIVIAAMSSRPVTSRRSTCSRPRPAGTPTWSELRGA